MNSMYKIKIKLVMQCRGNQQYMQALRIHAVQMYYLPLLLINFLNLFLLSSQGKFVSFLKCERSQNRTLVI